MPARGSEDWSVLQKNTRSREPYIFIGRQDAPTTTFDRKRLVILAIHQQNFSKSAGTIISAVLAYTGGISYRRNSPQIEKDCSATGPELFSVQT